MPQTSFRCLCLLLCSVWGSVWANALLPSPHLLPAEKAYALDSYWLDEADNIHLHWRITPGYHLYRDQFTFQAERHVRLGRPQFEPPHLKNDPVVGSVAWYATDTTVVVPIERAPAGDLRLEVSFQGCSEHGFCYPPSNTTAHLKVPAPIQKDITWLSGFPLHVVIFYFYGLLLGFTPCILPMVPILLGVLLSEHHAQRRRRDHVLLGATYVLSMALTYAVAGLLTAIMGTSLQGMLQTPSVVIASAAVLFLLGTMQWFEPSWSRATPYNTLLDRLSRHLPKHGLLMASGMGVLAALVASPCVTPPLIGALALIAQEGAWLEGAVRFFLLGLGLGTPLLLVALFGRDVLPQSGPWLGHTQTAAGALLMGLSISFLERIEEGPLTLCFWVVLLLCTAWRLARGDPQERPKGLTPVIWLLFAYSFALAYQGTQEHYALRAPWHLIKKPTHTELVVFREINALAELNPYLKQAQHEGRPVLVEFTADWCASCRDNKEHLWSNPAVAEALGAWLLVRADITRQSPVEQALMLHHAVFAPPTLLFFNPQGKEDPEDRLYGSLKAAPFLLHLQGVFDTQPPKTRQPTVGDLDTAE